MPVQYEAPNIATAAGDRNVAVLDGPPRDPHRGARSRAEAFSVIPKTGEINRVACVIHDDDQTLRATPCVSIHRVTQSRNGRDCQHSEKNHHAANYRRRASLRGAASLAHEVRLGRRAASGALAAVAQHE